MVEPHLNEKTITEVVSEFNPDSQREFRKALGRFTTGINVITCYYGNEYYGLTANSFSSVSLDPPLVLWCLQKRSKSFAGFSGASHFAINVLASDQVAISQSFGRSGQDKFASIEFLSGIGGAPVLPETAAVFECRQTSQFDGGDHVIIVGQVERFRMSDRRPLVFSEGRYSAVIDHPSNRALSRSFLDGTDPGRLDQFISVLLLRAFNRLQDEMIAIRESEGISIDESRVLNIASAYPNRSLSELTPVLYLGEAAAEEAAANLKSKGMIAEGNDGSITITPKGARCSSRLMSHIADMERWMMEGVDADRIDSLRSILLAIIEKNDRFESEMDGNRTERGSDLVPQSTTRAFGGGHPN